jgi:hypothetical protein
MAGALEVVRFRDIVPILQVTRFIPGLQPLTMEIKGEDFSSVEKVMVNDSPVSEYIVINKQTLWITLPQGSRTVIRNLEVLSSNFTLLSEASKLSFEIGNKTRSTTGLVRLVQLFTKWLLQTPGSDILNPERGGGLQEIAGKMSASKEMQPVLAALTKAVSITSSQIRRMQLNNPGLSLDERLLSAEVSDLKIYSEQMEARISVDVLAMSGNRALSSISV